MKKTLLCVFLLLAGMLTNAQIVTIPDAALKAQLLSASATVPVTADSNYNFFTLDANGDGEIQQSEADSVYQLIIGSDAITSYEGIQHFTNAGYIDCNIFSPIAFDFSGMPNLTHLQCQGDISGIVINGSQSIDHLDFSYNIGSTINLANLPALKELFFYSGQYTNLTFQDLPSLQSIRLEENPLTALTLNNLPVLQTLRVPDSQLTSLDLSGVSSIRWLILGGPLTACDLSVLTHLDNLMVGGTQLTDIDLSNAANLYSMTINANPLLQHINLKNGSIANGYYISNNPGLESICIDENEESAIFADLQMYNETVMLTTYCTFTPGGSYNTIAGTLTFDADDNGCDAADVLIPYGSITIDGGGTAGTVYTTTGNYDFYTQAGTFTLTPGFENDWFTATPQTVTFATLDNSTATQNFCVTANGIHPDLTVIITSVVRARPGFDAVYKVIYGNKGNQTLSGSAMLTYNDDVLDYVSAFPAESSSSSGSHTWDFTNLRPFEYRTVTVTLNANNPIETPAVNIGDVLPFTVSITPTTGDETPLDNTFAFNQVVVGSLDPNEITCLEGANVDPTHIGEYLHYTINFENTGTAPATFIAVKDMIDATKFDISSLQVLDASHPVQTRSTGNKLEFYFADINLAGGAKGNVTFKIKSLATLAANSTVTQQADIYFDYNLPVTTNEATTTYALLSTGSFIKDASVALYPNPAKTSVTIKSSSDITAVELYDIQGRLLQAGTGNTLDVSNRSAGLYFVKVTTAKGTSVEKLVKE